MSVSRTVLRAVRAVPRASRPFGTSSTRLNVNHRKNDTQEQYEKIQKGKDLNPHMTNTNSTIANAMPSVGKDSAPPEMITSVDPNFTPKDSKPSNTSRMTGETQKPGPESGENADLDVGEIEGGTFRVEPLRRTGEDIRTMRARLIYQSRKRGTLESDLLLSTFADANLNTMTADQLQAYDTFLDENDWDIYYWVTQEPPPTSQEYAEGGGPDLATRPAQGKDMPSKAASSTPTAAEGDRKAREPAQGEWAQTIGTFKPAYRPVPKRWKNSEILAMLRRHVLERSAGGLHIEDAPGVDGKALNQSVRGVGGGGLGQMPELKPQP